MNEAKTISVSDYQQVEKKHHLYLGVKRTIDVFLAAVLLVFLLPIFLLVFIAIKIEDKGPVFYAQIRTGKNGKNFKMYKFRSMTVATHKNGRKLVHEERITKVGVFLRKTSIDEIPQLINVIKGEMAIIGPRAWITEYYNNFTDSQKHRCDCLPGITGLAQVMGRNGLDIFDKIKFDLEYVNNISLKMDAKIILKSIAIIFKREHAEIIQEDIQTELQALSNQMH